MLLSESYSHALRTYVVIYTYFLKIYEPVNFWCIIASIFSIASYSVQVQVEIL